MIKENADIMIDALQNIFTACYISDNCLSCPAFSSEYGCRIKDNEGNVPADWLWVDELEDRRTEARHD